MMPNHVTIAGHYFTSVVAYNGALVPSPVACSDGVVYDIKAPRLLNVTIGHARVARALACTSALQDTWMVGPGLSRIRLSNTTTCSNVCSSNRSTVVSVEHLPVRSVYPVNERDSEDFCRSLPMLSEDAWIVLPSDRLYVTWDSDDEESQIEVNIICC